MKFREKRPAQLSTQVQMSRFAPFSYYGEKTHQTLDVACLKVFMDEEIMSCFD